MGAEAKFVEALEPIVSANGLEIWDIERAGSAMRILVDRPGGVDLDSLASLSSAISTFLDEHDELAPSGQYELDVSSPGLERRLRHPQHFARCLGQEVSVKTTAAVEGLRRFEGTLLSASDESVEVLSRHDDGSEFSVCIRLEEIEKARTVFRWPTPKNVRPKTGTKTAKPSKSQTGPQVPGVSAAGTDNVAAWAGSGKEVR